MSIEKRFLAKVKKTDSCWEWTGAKSRLGYGSFGFNGKTCGAHRVAWEIFCGKINDNLDCLHKCDNRGCVNPDHLFVGTHKDNMDDMARKGRKALLKGSLNGQSVLNEIKVIEIRKLRAKSGLSCKKIGAKYGVDRQTIWKIIKNKSWLHVYQNAKPKRRTRGIIQPNV